MNFLRTYSCTVQKYCSYNNINGVIKRCSHIFDKQEHDMPPDITKSILYPDYKIIYQLPYIKYAGVLNKVKRNCTVFLGSAIPAIGILTMQDLISAEAGMSNIACSFALAGITHIICNSCNNLIGVIYYKKDDNKVIISYVSYWGGRVDLFTDVNNIILQATSKIPRLYRMLYVKSHEKNLKIFMKTQNTTDESNFRETFGHVM